MVELPDLGFRPRPLGPIFRLPFPTDAPQPPLFGGVAQRFYCEEIQRHSLEDVCFDECLQLVGILAVLSLVDFQREHGAG